MRQFIPLFTFSLGAIFLGLGISGSSALCAILGISLIIVTFVSIVHWITDWGGDESPSRESKRKGENADNRNEERDNAYQSYTEDDYTSTMEEDSFSSGGYAPIPPNKYESQERRKNIFGKIIYCSQSEKTTIYTAALSIVALFSWVMRKDGSMGKSEMETVDIYFQKHPIYNDIFSSPPKDLLIDPISNTKHPTFYGYLDLLEFYNICPKLLRHGLCCFNILMSDIYYEAAMDLMKALFQVAYSSDGVIDSEMEILRSIAKELKIHREDWNYFQNLYGTRNKSQDQQQEKNKSSDKYGYSESRRSQQKRSEEAYNQDSRKSRRQQQQEQEEQKKSSTLGYKLTQAYNELGLLTTASESEIKKAYRKLVKKYHPDHLPPEATDQERKISADQFRLVKEAYDLIRLERGK